MKPRKKMLVLEKIPLERLINILMEVYNNGANYIDISGEEGNEQDIITIRVRDEYVEQEESQDTPPPSMLSDEDLDNLI